MARTSKMNMIMHGDGHGGVHHHDGFLNVNGIFEGRFDIILTNPPFGANVEPSDKVRTSDSSHNPMNNNGSMLSGTARHTKKPRSAFARPKTTPIATLSICLMAATRLRTGKRESGKIKTEILFIERCMALLKPGGRLGIVLPEGIFNNPSLSYVREFCEDRAFIRAVVSLPQETFFSPVQSVKASLLFMQKFSEEEAADYRTKRRVAISRSGCQISTGNRD